MIPSSQSLRDVLFPLSMAVLLFLPVFSLKKERQSLPHHGQSWSAAGSHRLRKNTGWQPRSWPDSLQNQTFYTLTRTGWTVINRTIWLLTTLICSEIHPQATAFSRLPYAQNACEAQVWVYIYVLERRSVAARIFRKSLPHFNHASVKLDLSWINDCIKREHLESDAGIHGCWDRHGLQASGKNHTWITHLAHSNLSSAHSVHSAQLEVWKCQFS